MWKHITSNFLSLMVVVLVVASGVVLLAQNLYKAPGPLAEPICLRVERGSNMRKVSEELDAKGAVSSGMLFRMGADYSDKSQKLKAGSYLVPEGASMEQIVDIVTRGGASTCGTEVVYRIGVTRTQIKVRELDPATNNYIDTADFVPAEEETPAKYTEAREQGDARYRIAMAEGVTSWQVAEALKAADFLEGEVENLPPEGMLAPDSYEVKPGDTRMSVLARMQAAQEAILDEAWAGRAEGLPLKSREEMLTLASLIEKETGVAKERPVVASVFINRLRQGIKLQTDPAVIYGITKGQGVLGRGLRQSELRRKTPYNTYVIEGLPPGPIANPGRDAIMAAVHPADTNYLFFVADGTGGHAFAETLKEHNENVAKWRKIESERGNN